MLLGILVLSAIMAISFSVATISLTEIKVSADLQKTEISYQGAVAISEEQLFKIKRRVPDSLTTPTTALGRVNFTHPPPTVNLTAVPILQIKIPPSDLSFTATKSRFPIFDSANTSSGSKYGRLKMTYLNTGNSDQLKFYLCQFNPTHGPYTGINGPKNACEDPDLSYSGSGESGYWLQVGTLDAGNNFVAELDPSYQQELILHNNNLAPIGDIYVQLETFGLSSASYPPQGIPLSGYRTLNITANNGEVFRKVEVIVPNR